MKKLIGFLLVLVTVLLCFTLSISANASETFVSDEGRLPFEDIIPGKWYDEEVEFCYANGIIKGMNDYTFAPEHPLTRAQFVTMLANLEGIDTSKYSVTVFNDVKSTAWYHGAVAWAYQQGIVSGMSEHKFSPNGIMDRQTLAQMMSMYMKKKGYEVTVSSTALDRFADGKAVSSWAKEAVKYMVSSGIMSGTSEDRFSPHSMLTRAQAARVLTVYVRNYLKGDCKHAFSERDCTTAAVCDKCGIVEGLALGHTVNAKEYNCISSATCLKCGEKAAPAVYTHDYTEATCSKPRTCKLCGGTRGNTLPHTWWWATCKNPKMCKVCYTTEGKALGHSWERADCVNPKTCKRCKLTEGSPLTETRQHTWWAATCVNPKMCKVCYVTSGLALGHKWKAATCTAPKTCTVCKVTTGEPVKNHKWQAATCAAPETCSICKATRGSAKPHTWWAATCKNPKMCKVCYKTEGKALGHIWKEADCLNPKTCTRPGCGITEGSAKGHYWKAATCFNPKYCTGCGDEEGWALGHTTSNGTCTRCGQKVNAPEYEKVISVLKKNGTHYNGSDEYSFLTLYGDNYTKLYYTATDNTVTVIHRYYYEDGSHANTGLNFIRGVPVCEYRYTYNAKNDPDFFGTVVLNSTTFTKDFKEVFSRQQGLFKQEYTGYMNDDLNRVLDDVNTMLKPYGLSVKDLGFKAY